MPSMEITLIQLDGEKTPAMATYITSIVILSKEKGAECELTSSGAIIEGNKETLLEILNEIDNVSLKKVGMKFKVALNFAKNHSKNSNLSEIQAQNREEKSG